MIMVGNTKSNTRNRIQERTETWALTTSHSTCIAEPGLRTVCPSNSQAYRVYDSDGIASTLRAEGGGVGAKTGLYAVPVMAPKRGWNGRGRRFKKDGEPSFTVTTRPPGVHDGHRWRMLTPLEVERLQAFPDNYTATGSDGQPISDRQRYRMIGNAVTVSVAARIIGRLA